MAGVENLPPSSGGEAAHPGHSSAAARWKRAGNAALATNALSTRLLDLRDQLGDDAYVDWSQLEEERVLGRGSFAVVYKMLYTPKQGRPLEVAVKQIRTELLRNKKDVQEFVAEAKLVRRLRYRYIVRFYGAGWSRQSEEEDSVKGVKPPGQTQLFFLQEYMEGGTLMSLVAKAMETGSEVYSDEDALRWALHIALALQYLHTRRPKVMHRDLKLENVLLSSRRPQKAVAKLADFGLARKLEWADDQSKQHVERLKRVASIRTKDLDAAARERSAALSSRMSSWASKSSALLAEGLEEKTAMMGGVAGSMGYMAPEVLKGEQYNEKADVFSFAVIVYNIFHRDIPTYHIMAGGNMQDLEAYAHKVANGFRQPISPRVPPGVASLIERCWQGEPKRRPSMGQVAAELQELQPPRREGDSPDEDSDGGDHDKVTECTCSLM